MTMADGATVEQIAQTFDRQQAAAMTTADQQNAAAATAVYPQASHQELAEVLQALVDDVASTDRRPAADEIVARIRVVQCELHAWAECLPADLHQQLALGLAGVIGSTITVVPPGGGVIEQP